VVATKMRTFTPASEVAPAEAINASRHAKMREFLLMPKTVTVA